MNVIIYNSMKISPFKIIIAPLLLAASHFSTDLTRYTNVTFEFRNKSLISCGISNEHSKKIPSIYSFCQVFQRSDVIVFYFERKKLSIYVWRCVNYPIKRLHTDLLALFHSSRQIHTIPFLSCFIEWIT